MPGPACLPLMAARPTTGPPAPLTLAASSLNVMDLDASDLERKVPSSKAMSSFDISHNVAARSIICRFTS